MKKEVKNVQLVQRNHFIQTSKICSPIIKLTQYLPHALKTPKF